MTTIVVKRKLSIGPEENPTKRARGGTEKVTSETVQGDSLESRDKRKRNKLVPPRPFPTVPTSVSATGPRSAHTEGKNYICITRRTNLGAYLRRCKEVIMVDGHKSLHLSAMGAAIPHLLALAASLPDILPFGPDEIHTSIVTGTVEVMDEMIPANDAEDIVYETRGKSTVNVVITIGDGVDEERPKKKSKGGPRKKMPRTASRVFLSEPAQDEPMDTRTRKRAAESDSLPTTRASKAAKTSNKPASKSKPAAKKGPKANLSTTAFKSNALPLHVNLTHTPPAITEDDSTTPSHTADPGFLGAITLLPSSFNTGSYGWKGNKRLTIEIDNPDGSGKEKVHVQLTINATVLGSKSAKSEDEEEEKPEEEQPVDPVTEIEAANEEQTEEEPAPKAADLE